MAGAQPKAKADDYADQVDAMWDSLVNGHPLNEIAWRKLYRDIEKLADIAEFAPFAFRTMATLWSFKGNVGEVEKNFRIYSGRFGKDWQWYFARASLGPALSRLDMVMDFFNWDYPVDDPSKLLPMLEIANQAGLFVAGMQISKRLVRMGVDNIHEKTSAPLSQMEAAANYLSNHRIDEYEVALRLQCSSKVVRRMVGRLTSYTLTANQYGISYEYVINQDIESLIDIDMEISEALCLEFDDTLAEHLTICTAIDEEPEQYAGQLQ